MDGLIIAQAPPEIGAPLFGEVKTPKGFEKIRTSPVVRIDLVKTTPRQTEWLVFTLHSAYTVLCFGG